MKTNMQKPFDLFPRSREIFSDEIFQNPTAEYRGTPLWSWNSKLTEDQLMRQIDDLEKMGFGGFHMHVRVGLETEYLGPEFMQLVQKCVARAKEKGMLAWLYDEDRWPSGYAGGKFTAEKEEYRSRHLLFTPWAYGDETGPDPEADMHVCSAKAMRSELGHLLARYSVTLDDKGFLTESRKLKDGEDAENIWYAYLETNPPSEWFNGSYYVDALSRAAMAKFVEVTYEPYKKAVGAEFGKTVPAIFTDEPQFAMKNQLKRAHDKRDIFMPWTLDLEESYRKAYSSEILETIPELIWDKKSPSKARYNYHDHVCDRFVDAFIDQLGDWCNLNGIALTGHMMQEPTLYTQTGSLGEAMRCYRNMHLPGIDLLCDRKEYNTAKQCQSVSRQYGRCGGLSEIYGVTNWTFTFEGHKGCGDWQTALGINVRCHHLAWLSMAGEAKRDYPAAIGYQSSWYKEYPLIEDYFSRVHTALTRGKAVVKVGVIHPIESYWLAFGPKETSLDQEERDRQFYELTDWLSFGLIDFDFISESLLVEQSPHVTGTQLAVGHQKYDTILVPNLKTIRSTTLNLLRNFSKAGGNIIIAGSLPELIDAGPAPGGMNLPGRIVPFSKYDILQPLEHLRDVKAVLDSGLMADSLLYQMRSDGEDEFIFICNTDRSQARDCRVDIRGHWATIFLDAMTGKKFTLPSRIYDGWTHFDYRFEGCASILLQLLPRSTLMQLPLLQTPKWQVFSELMDCEVSLSEPNVLLLDMACHKIDDDKEWSHVEEILRIDNIARQKLGLRLKKDAFAQPYARKRLAPEHTLHLEFLFESKIDVSGSFLALENASDTTILLDGQAIPSNKPSGWWVDEAISKISLPDLPAGKHTIHLSIPFADYTNIERIYLLGSFGVDLRGRRAQIVPLDLESVTIGDYTRQGLPFYAGNTHYEFTLDVPTTSAGRIAIQVPRFAGPLLTVDVDGSRAGAIAFQPHILDLGHLAPGSHQIRVTAYGNRDHAFGAVHLPAGKTNWYGPDAWRTAGEYWSYEYTIREMGLLTAPRVLSEIGLGEVNGWDAGSVNGFLS